MKTTIRTRNMSVLPILMFSVLINTLLISNMMIPKQSKKSTLAEDKGEYRVVLTLERRQMKDFTDSNRWWGTAFQKYPKMVTDMRVYRKKKEIVLPGSAFSDLAYIFDIGIKPQKDGCVITLYGADAGNSYLAKLTIKNGELVQREVHLDGGGSPAWNWEKTIYHGLPAYEPTPADKNRLLTDDRTTAEKAGGKNQKSQ